MTDASIKEEDQEIDIASYSTQVSEEAPKDEPETETVEEDSQIHVDVDKVYDEE